MSSRATFSLTRTNICNFFKILKSKCSLFAANRCKTVGTKQETWSKSETMMTLDKNSVFLANFCSKTKILTPRKPNPTSTQSFEC